MHALTKLTILALSCTSATFTSCEKQPASSTTYITNNEPAKVEDNNDPKTKKQPSELASVAGQRSSGKLYLRYTINTNEVKKWTILAPYEIKLHEHFIEVSFTGNYYMDGEPTGNGEKKLFIKKEDIKTILVSE